MPESCSRSRFARTPVARITMSRRASGRRTASTTSPVLCCESGAPSCAVDRDVARRKQRCACCAAVVSSISAGRGLRARPRRCHVRLCIAFSTMKRRSRADEHHARRASGCLQRSARCRTRPVSQASQRLHARKVGTFRSPERTATSRWRSAGHRRSVCVAQRQGRRADRRSDAHAEPRRTRPREVRRVPVYVCARECFASQ